MKLVLIFLFQIISLSLFAQGLEAEIEFKDSPKELLVGDPLSATLRIWPLENLNEADKKQILEKDLFRFIKIVEIEKIQTSENNADILEIKFSGVVISEKKNWDQEIFVNGNPVKINSTKLQIKAFNLKGETYLYADQRLFKNKIIYLVIAILALLMIGWIFYRRKRNPSPVTTNDLDQIKKLILEAKNRNDFEKLYQVRNRLIISELLKNEKDDFFQMVNEKQYKKDWSEIEIQLIRENFEKLKGKLNVL